MKTVAHLVVTENFAGTERYVCQLANASARRKWRVHVIGGDPARMRAELSTEVLWLPGASLMRAARSLYGLGDLDVCHSHLTLADVVATGLRWRHRGRQISTRHIAAPRGSSSLGRLAAPWVGRHLHREIAISQFVSDRILPSPSVVIHNGVPDSAPNWKPGNRNVLLVQRLEPEKQTRLALQAWQASKLGDQGWSLRIVGDGSERDALQSMVCSHDLPNVQFLGSRNDVPRHLAEAGMFLATAPGEPLGLSVLEAMAAGIPVVASQGGGHLETLTPRLGVNGFPPGDFEAAADCLVRLAANVGLRGQLALGGRERQREDFTLDRMVDRIHRQYADA